MSRVAWLLALCLSSPIFADTVRNGGDIVTCRDEAGAPFHGSVLLDYAATFDSPDLIADTGTDLEVANALGMQLLQVYRPLGESLKDFLDDYALQVYQKMADREFKWQQQRFGIITLDDQQLGSVLPPNCYTVDAQGKKVLALRQVVVQERRDQAYYKEFREEFRTRFSKTKKPADHVFQLNIQLFSHTQS